MDAVVAALITALVGGPIFYALGTRQRRLEVLYERRAQVIARMSELLFVMQRGFSTWASPFQSAGVDRVQQRKAASDAFQELVLYYHSNSVWLDPRTCDKVESVMETAWTAAWDYADELDERGYPQNQAGRDASKKLWRDLPGLRRDLEDEFRAILYPPPWYDALLQFLDRIQTRNQQTSEPTPDRPVDGSGDSEKPQG